MVAAGGAGGRLILVERVDQVVEAPPQQRGPYALRLLAADGSQLASHPFSPAGHHDEEGGMSFLEVLPFADGTRTIQLVHLASGAVLDSQAVSPAAPAVANVSVGGPEPLQGTVELMWTASDADGDSLGFDLLFSRDGGATFQIAQASLTGASASVDTAALPGGSLIFRVRASDGVNTSYADSAAVEVAMKAPRPIIMSPPGGTHSEYGGITLLAGYALDAQDDTISSLEGLTWLEENEDGSEMVFGHGPTLTLRGLDPGAHTIQLRATNSEGLSASTEIVLTVSDDLNDRLPALAASPTQVTWQVENGESDPQTATVQILNAGGLGTLEWTASSSESWLNLDSTAGTGEYDLLLTAATAGMPENATLTAVVTISATHAGGQETIEVPVLLQTGAGEIWAPAAPVVTYPYSLFLPLVNR
jgi:hypothetical protein